MRPRYARDEYRDTEPGPRYGNSSGKEETGGPPTMIVQEADSEKVGAARPQQFR